ncbi:hypothetical protein [Photobacterium sp. OFAV2-7]|uniref:hypothetical protein n=1 Tax=Photobacterium sp. OFAV2-7 TaxID=2917748 RepID=UPI001EF61B1D|nr:hypothetical protein [Photobacterium sp. OFAV2-7]MCG7584794.1 hypothetical protein [Photobacterium sp. OFAV2-7]
MNTTYSQSECRHALQSIVRDLQQGRLTLSEIWQQKGLLWQELGWSKAQLKLWLGCLPGIERAAVDTDDPSYGFASASNDKSVAKEAQQNDLGESIVAIVADVGRPTPIKIILSKLPAGMVATEVMVRKAAQGHPRLMMMGPLVRLK